MRTTADVRCASGTGCIACATLNVALHAFGSAARLLAHLATFVAWLDTGSVGSAAGAAGTIHASTVRATIATALACSSMAAMASIATLAHAAVVAVAMVVATSIVAAVVATSTVSAIVSTTGVTMIVSATCIAVVVIAAIVDAMVVAAMMVVAAGVRTFVPGTSGNVMGSVVTRTIGGMRPEVVASTPAMNRTGTSIHVVAVATASIVSVGEVVATVSSEVGVIDQRRIVVEEPRVGVVLIDAEQPVAGVGVDRTEEVVQSYKSQVLCLGHDVAQVVVAVIQVVVVTVDILGITIYHFVHERVDRCDEIVVDLVAVLILLRGKVQLVGHSIGQETCILADCSRGQSEGLNHTCDGYCHGNK